MDRDTAATSRGRLDPAAAADDDEPRVPGAGHEPPTQSMRDAMGDLSELREYALYFLTAKLDGAKLSVKRLGVMAVLGILGLLAGGAVIATAAVLVCIGLALGLGRLLGGHYWAGYLIVGVVVLTGVALGMWLVVSRIFKSSRKATVQKYELRRTRQRADFGHDVGQRAAEKASPSATSV